MTTIQALEARRKFGELLELVYYKEFAEKTSKLKK